MSRHPWPLGLAAREGVATARTGRWTSLLMALAVTWLVAAPGAADAIAVSGLVDDEEAWIDAGGYVFVVTGSREDNSQNPIPAAACEGLASVGGIEGAFALRRTDATGTLSYIPGGRVSLYDVSAGALSFLGAGSSAGGVLLATAGFVERTGVADDDVVTVVRRGATGTVPAQSDPLTVRAVDTTVMGDEFDGALLVPAQLVGTADACYVRTDAAHYSAVEAALPSVLAYEGKPAIPNPRLFGSDFTVDYSHAYEERALRWVWVPAAALIGLLWAMLQWFRRSHVAIYATFGMPPASRLVMQLGEWSALAGFGALWGWGLGVVGAVAFGAHVSQALRLVTLHGLLAVIGASAVVVVLGLRPGGTLLNALKDR